MNTETLIAILKDLPEVDLLALRLMRNEAYRTSPGLWFPTGVPMEMLVEATNEMMGYQQRCREMKIALAGLAAVEVGLSIPEYGL